MKASKEENKRTGSDEYFERMLEAYTVMPPAHRKRRKKKEGQGENRREEEEERGRKRERVKR